MPAISLGTIFFVLPARKCPRSQSEQLAELAPEAMTTVLLSLRQTAGSILTVTSSVFKYLNSSHRNSQSQAHHEEA